MKKKSILLSLLTAGVLCNAQVRMTLYEEFTGENCPPCAATNPGLDAILAANASKVIALKWQVPIPSAPSNTWSLYQTNKTEIDWRYTAGGYGYQSQNTPTNSATNGINSAPQGRFDGQHQWVFGAASNHPANVNATVINNAANASTPFSIQMSTNWDPTFSNCAVTATVTASAPFTAVGSLVFRLCLVERRIEFATPSGTNGEKLFHDVVRKSYPTIQAGTALPSGWVASQQFTFTVNCAIPSYIVDKSEMAFVGFIQDDGDKKIWQAHRTNQPSIPNDAKLVSIAMPSFSCANAINPSIVVYNQGPNAITDMTIVPVIDGVNQTPFNYTGNIASLATSTITLGSYTATPGNHTVQVNITGVSGGDVNTANNSKTTQVALIQTYFPGPVTQAFPTNPFPPANWFMTNADNGPSWSRNATAGYNGAGSAKYDFYNNSVIGDKDELYVLPTDLTGVNSPILTFDVAYAQYSNENDRLQVMVSTNCGASWTTIFDKAGSVLKTVNAQTGAFTPNANNQWRNESVNLPPSAANNPSVLVKFVATADYGNNMYIDNVNIQNNSTSSINTHNADIFNIQLYPNPATNSANFDITSKKATSGLVSVYNALGQLVIEKKVNVEAGYNHIELSTEVLSSGVYNLVFSSDLGTHVKKLNISK